MNDFTNELAKIFREHDADKKKELKEKIGKEVVPVQLKLIDDRLGKSGSGFIASSGFTWVDLYVFVVADWIPEREQTLATFKNIKAAHDKISAMPGIAEWLKTRPVTEM